MSRRFHWDDYLRYKVSPANPEVLRHADVDRYLRELSAKRPGAVDVHLLGQSVEGRDIDLITVGHGPQPILLWSQMHGDEATHTAVLVDLLNFLQADPDHPWAAAILGACTLHLIPMLNPDGAERFTRRNAQDIDINRDARRLQTPEGRLLMAARESLRPQMAFNLHDQHERTAVGRSGRAAAVSLLVPPLDDAGTVTPQIRQAEQIAGTFHRAVAPHCAGMVSRYDGAYMPNCFGEAMQQAGVTTVLVEAGGWHAHDMRELVQLHFFGLLTTLHDVATDSLVDPGSPWYYNLERSGEAPLFDLLIAGTRVENGHGHPAFHADVGINGPGRKRRHNGCAPAGRIEDVGDLHMHGGRATIDGTGLVCLPGQIVFDPGIRPDGRPDAAAARQWLRQGITTIIGLADLHDPAVPEQLAAWAGDPRTPINVGFVGVWNQPLDRRAALPRAVLQSVAGRELLAIATPAMNREVADSLHRWNVPLVSLATLSRWAAAPPSSLRSIAELARRRATCLRIDHRGQIGRRAVADLLLVPDSPSSRHQGPSDACNPEFVVLNGHLAYQADVPIDQFHGLFLQR